jgi:hypothetical protein
MTKAGEFFLDLVNEIPGAKLGKMFGAWCIKAPNGKAAAMFLDESMVVKLQGEALNESLSLDGTKPFEPMEGKQMKEWVQIPFEYKNKWKKFASISIETVNNTIPKISGKNK